MSESKAVRCDGPGCTSFATLKSPRTHPEDWYRVYGPAPDGVLDFCMKACVSQYFRPFAGQASTVVTVTGAGGGSGALTIVGESGAEYFRGAAG